MNLKKYLEENKLTQSRFASLIGVSRFQVNSLVHGRKTPSFKSMKRIEKVTGGLVTIHDFPIEDVTDDIPKT